MAAKKLVWEFPQKRFFLMKIETTFVAILAIIIFFFSLSPLGLGWAILFSLSFLVIYSIVSYVVQHYRQASEKYHLTPSHLHIHSTVGEKIKKEKVALKDIRHHKLDKFFLGGYLLTHKGKKHLLFFNTKNEILKFEDFVKKKFRPLKKATKIKKKK